MNGYVSNHFEAGMLNSLETVDTASFLSHLWHVVAWFHTHLTPALERHEGKLKY